MTHAVIQSPFIIINIIITIIICMLCLLRSQFKIHIVAVKKNWEYIYIYIHIYINIRSCDFEPSYLSFSLFFQVRWFIGVVVVFTDGPCLLVMVHASSTSLNL